MDSHLQQIFEEEFGRPPSAVLERAALTVLGEEYPSGLDTYSWVSRTELRRTVDALRGVHGQVADLGCGRGGPGLWVAGMVGAPLVGIDIAESALAQARQMAIRLDVPAEFRVGTFEQTGLEAASLAAVISFDAFLFTPDKAAAFRELARILTPGGLLVMTSWDYHTQPAGRPPQVADHRPLAEAAGLSVLAYEETVDWRHRCHSFADYLLAHVEDLADESGATVEQARADVEVMRATIDCMTRRFLLIARSNPS